MMSRFLCFGAILLVGCTAVERADIASDVAAGLPGVITDVQTGGTAGAVAGAVTLLVTIATGYVVRKFITKKYAGVK